MGESAGTCPVIHQLCLEEVPWERWGPRFRWHECSPLSPSAEKSIPLRILYEKYCDCLTESNLIKVRGLLIEPAANSYLLAERDIYLENPEIKIRVRAGSPGPDPTPASTSLPADSRSVMPQASSNPSFIKEKHHETEFGTHSL